MEKNWGDTPSATLNMYQREDVFMVMTKKKFC